MKERPILFSAEMVRAILGGRKTQTRRVIKPQPFRNGFQATKKAVYDSRHPAFIKDRCPYGVPGDRLWVRETWNAGMIMAYCNGEPEIMPWSHCTKEERKTFPVNQVFYKANGDLTNSGPWIPSIFMPRKFSRITLEVTGIRVERVQDIGMEDICSEGLDRWRDYEGGEHLSLVTMKNDFLRLWDSINGKKYPWGSNPWVFVISFRRIGDNGDPINELLDEGV